MSAIDPQVPRTRLRRVHIPGTVTVPAPCQALRNKQPGNARTGRPLPGTNDH
ncbi:hypothetical protein [Streptomyces sp. LN785]|uniref:hypothetical protein n=1 Tax=Streptomyces sp. LN785 TaxID=3112983 RepID=UPI003718B4AB